MQTQKSAEQFKNSNGIKIAALLVISIALYGYTLSFDFLRLDDPWHLLENPNFIPNINWKSYFNFWAQPYAHLYIPITYSVWSVVVWFNQLFSGGPLNPAFFRALNLVFHILNTCLVYMLLNNLLQSKVTKKFSNSKVQLSALFGAILFSVHPIQSATIGWISAFKDLLCTFLSLTSIMLSLHSERFDPEKEEAKLNRAILSSMLFYCIAILSKPSAIITPVIIATLQPSFHPKNLILKRKRNFQLFIGLIIGLATILITRIAQPDFLNPTHVPFFERLWVMVDAYGYYLRELVFPIRISGDHGRTPQFLFKNGPDWFSFLPFALLLVFIQYRRKLSKDFFRACFLFFVCLLPVSGIIPFAYQAFSTVADHYLYFPMIWVSFAFALATAHLIPRRENSIALISGILIVAFGWTCFNLPHWKTSENFYKAILDDNPRSTIALEGLGGVEMERGNLELSLHYFEKAAKIQANLLAIGNLATVLKKMNRLDQIETIMKQQVEATIRNPASVLGNEVNRIAMGRIASLLADLEITRGNLREAIPSLTLATQAQPYNAEFHFNLGIVKNALNDHEGSKKEFLEACQLEPKNPRFQPACH